MLETKDIFLELFTTIHQSTNVYQIVRKLEVHWVGCKEIHIQAVRNQGTAYTDRL